MTTAEDIKKHLQEVPFKPFRLHLTDGRTFDVKHPDFLFVLKSRVIIGLPDQDELTIPDRAEFVSLLHVVSIEELQAA